MYFSFFRSTSKCQLPRVYVRMAHYTPTIPISEWSQYPDNHNNNINISDILTPLTTPEHGSLDQVVPTHCRQ